MVHLRLKKLQQCAIHDVMARTSDANNATMATRIGELNSLHVAASMDIEKTTQSLNNILTYKKELALTELGIPNNVNIKSTSCTPMSVQTSTSLILDGLGEYL